MTVDEAVQDDEQFLELANVNVARGDRVVLHDVNLTIRAGEHVAILGPNGCGKSTLIFTITCQIYPIVQPGNACAHLRARSLGSDAVTKHFGVVSAGPSGTELPGERTAVTTGLDAVIAGFFSPRPCGRICMLPAKCAERAVEALERIEASHLAGQVLGEMSAGEKRRILIAGRWCTGPRQLLDEPSNALDLAAQRDLRETLRRLAPGGNRAGAGDTLSRRYSAGDRARDPDAWRTHRRRRTARRTFDRAEAQRTLPRTGPYRPR